MVAYPMLSKAAGKSMSSSCMLNLDVTSGWPKAGYLVVKSSRFCVLDLLDLRIPWLGGAITRFGFFAIATGGLGRGITIAYIEHYVLDTSMHLDEGETTTCLD